GYHIVAVTSLPNDLTYQVATIERVLEASPETEYSIRARLDSIAKEAKTLQGLRDFVKKNPQYALEISIINNYAKILLGSLESKDIYLNAFHTPEGELLPIEQAVNADKKTYWLLTGVAMLTHEDKTDIRAVRYQLIDDVCRDKKTAYICSKIDLQASSLEDIAQKSGLVANIKDTIEVSLDKDVLVGEASMRIIFSQENTPAHLLPTLLEFEKQWRGEPHLELNAVGTAMGLAQGQRSQAIAGKSGVFVIEKIADLPAIMPTKEAISATQEALTKSRQDLASYYTHEALKKLKKVKDYRYKYW
ncbi:MAG: hypothetical protein EAZ95_11825, partial [Bacteroidetes bacterium]